MKTKTYKIEVFGIDTEGKEIACHYILDSEVDTAILAVIRFFNNKMHIVHKFQHLEEQFIQKITEDGNHECRFFHEDTSSWFVLKVYNDKRKKFQKSYFLACK